VPRFNFTEGTADVEDADVKALLQEVDSALNRFENVAKTYKCWAMKARPPTRFRSGRPNARWRSGRRWARLIWWRLSKARCWPKAACDAHEHWLDIYPPSNWTHGSMSYRLEWHALATDTDLNRLTDDAINRGLSGPGAPLVRRAIEHVRHLSWVSAMATMCVCRREVTDGKPALLFTFLGRVQSQQGVSLSACWRCV